jgi:hypothetical protein
MRLKEYPSSLVNFKARKTPLLLHHLHLLDKETTRTLLKLYMMHHGFTISSPEDCIRMKMRQLHAVCVPIGPGWKFSLLRETCIML